ncbi:MAG: hypothetical protein FVQ77_04610 [Cytophagales bacterium]|nr:hypothetical protein [Cytophagales bacterium]
MARQLIYFITFITLTLSFSGCKKVPEWDKMPRIEFREIKKKNCILYPSCCNSICNGDSIFINIYFKDGDGDIGLTSDDPTPEFNFYVNLLIEKDTIFKPFEYCDSNACAVFLWSQNEKSRIPPLYPEGYSGPLDGTIDYSIFLLTNELLDPCCRPFEHLDSAMIKFTIQLVDRALNKSNKVETSPITISK